jgi:transposase-like protein
VGGGGRGPLESAEEATKVPKKGHSEEQILRALQQAESGERIADICREHGMSEATFYSWKKKIRGTCAERGAGAAAVAR